MGIAVLRGFLFFTFLAASFVGLSQVSKNEPVRIDILVERIERVSRDEVHFRVKVRNRSDRSIFLTAINYELFGIKDESGPRPYPVYLEQWRAKEGWTTISCIDTPPPHVVKLNPSEMISEESWAKLPMSVICRNRIAAWEGKFRFRLEYFESEKQARAYVKKIFSRRWREAHAAVALSEPFEIPSASNPEAHPRPKT